MKALLSNLSEVRQTAESTRPMNDGPVTQPSLLLRIRDADDQEAWNQFVDIYAPIVHQFACRKGIQAADAADVTQEVMKKVAANIGRFQYDQNKGRFRAWLYTTTKNQVINFSQRFGRVRGSGNSDVHQLLSEEPDRKDQNDWDSDFRHVVFDYAVKHVRSQFEEKTWLAFEKTAIQHLKPAQVARALELSVGAIYVAKSRVVARLREFVEQISDRWDDISPFESEQDTASTPPDASSSKKNTDNDSSDHQIEQVV